MHCAISFIGTLPHDSVNSAHSRTPDINSVGGGGGGGAVVDKSCQRSGVGRDDSERDVDVTGLDPSEQVSMEAAIDGNVADQKGGNIADLGLLLGVDEIVSIVTEGTTDVNTVQPGAVSPGDRLPAVESSQDFDVVSDSSMNVSVMEDVSPLFLH